MKRLILLFSLLVASQAGMAAQQCLSAMKQSAPNARFIYQASGVVTDKQTGLTWMRCSVGKTWNNDSQGCEGDATPHTWQNALVTVQSINSVGGNHALHQFAGIENWRMPNIKELVSLREEACHSPAMNGKAFAGSYSLEIGDELGYIWSATPSSNGQNVMVFDTVNGEVYPFAFTDSAYSVLLVADQ